MMLFLNIFLALIGVATSSFAEDRDYEKEGVKFAKEHVQELKKLDLEKVVAEKDKLKKPKGEAAQGESCNGCHVNLENPMANFEKEIDGEDRILVFVSFSMPNIAIKELNDQAQKYRAKLILRGLHEQSFKKTAKKILEIDKDGVKLDINPELFKKYGIKKVPTFILIRNGKEVSQLSGNVSLEYAKSKMVEE